MHTLSFVLSPGQLLFRADTAGFWQVRVLDCNPGPHVELHPLQPDQDVHPMAPGIEGEWLCVYVFAARYFTAPWYAARIELNVTNKLTCRAVLHSSLIRDPDWIKRNKLWYLHAERYYTTQWYAARIELNVTNFGTYMQNGITQLLDTRSGLN